MPAIETKGLTKRYGALAAVDHMDLTVRQGELLALLGVNGAGKTTAIRMMCGLSAPTEGDALICGHSVLRDRAAVKGCIGLSPQDSAVAEHLTVRENLLFMARIQGLSGQAAQARTAEVLRLMGLDAAAHRPAGVLSGGWQRRLSIAMALIGTPRVLFLDEPTLGLDVLARRELWQIIRSLKGHTTILLTTHYMEEAAQLADRIAVMTGGRIAAQGTLAELEALSGKTGLEEAFIAIAEGSMRRA